MVPGPARAPGSEAARQPHLHAPPPTCGLEGSLLPAALVQHRRELGRPARGHVSSRPGSARCAHSCRGRLGLALLFPELRPTDGMLAARPGPQEGEAEREPRGQAQPHSSPPPHHSVPRVKSFTQQTGFTQVGQLPFGVKTECRAGEVRPAIRFLTRRQQGQGPEREWTGASSPRPRNARPCRFWAQQLSGAAYFEKLYNPRV